MPGAYIHQLPAWPNFRWNQAAVALQLSEVRLSKGVLIGKLTSLGFGQVSDTFVNALTNEIRYSNEIEGEILDHAQVRSSVARRRHGWARYGLKVDSRTAVSYLGQRCRLRPAPCAAESASRTEATLMKRSPLPLALPALVAITATARATDDPDTVLREIRTENSKRLQEQQPDIAALIKTRAVGDAAGSQLGVEHA